MHRFIQSFIQFILAPTISINYDECISDDNYINNTAYYDTGVYLCFYVFICVFICVKLIIYVIYNLLFY